MEPLPHDPEKLEVRAIGTMLAQREITEITSPNAATCDIEDASAIDLPALGEQFELGMLYDARTRTSFAGISLWNLRQIEENQQVVAQPNTDFYYTSSMEELQSRSGLDVEGAISIQFGICKPSGSAKYLDQKRKSTHEARIFVTCSVKKQVRRIPQEVLVKMCTEKHLENPQYTHFVAEVLEGGSATILIRKRCSNAGEQRRIQTALAGKFSSSLSIEGNISTDSSKKSEQDLDNLDTQVYGVVQDPIGSIEQAAKIGTELPKTLASCENTLKVKLLPLSALDSGVRRVIRSMDEHTLKRMVETLKSHEVATLKIQDITQAAILHKFPIVKRQCENFMSKLDARTTAFRECVRRLLPKIKDGTVNRDTELHNLVQVTSIARHQAEIAENYILLKDQECRFLETTVADLVNDRFADIPVSLSLTESRPSLFISLSGDVPKRHPLEKKLASTDSRDNSSEETEDDEDDDEDEWFKRATVLEYFNNSCKALRELRSSNDLAQFDASYGVAVIPKAAPMTGGAKKRKTAFGDIILLAQGKLQVITQAMPFPPVICNHSVIDQDITLQWEMPDKPILPTTAFRIEFQRSPNSELDEFDQAIGPNELPEAELIADSQAKEITLHSLWSFTDYRISIQTRTKAGFSQFSDPPLVVRTHKKPTVASEIITFFLNKHDRLTSSPGRKSSQHGKPWERKGGRKAWEMSNDSLFLGFTTAVVQKDHRDVAVLVVDVAPEFKPDIGLGDEKDAKVVMFVGKTGCGKSTEVNALVSYLLEGQLGDKYRIMLIDDRGLSQSRSVTRYITVYRLRPLSTRFPGTLYIVDTPGYGDTEGHKRDTFVTRAMSLLFKTIKHVNAVIFTSLSNETRATPGMCGVAAHVFQLFSREVRVCLRTILTFSDAGKAPALDVLKNLGWPVENGVIEVNNAAFKVTGKETENLKRWWDLTMSGQREVADSLRGMVPVPTDRSAQVTDKRMSLNQKCELAEKKVLNTANQSQMLLANMNALANAVGASPQDKVEITVQDVKQEPVADGNHTTLCPDCNFTCHDVCAYGDDKDKKHCVAMNWTGHCTQCRGKCYWKKHKNASFILRAVSRTENVVPEDLIKKWNENTNTLEGALLDALDQFLRLQSELLKDIHELHDLTLELQGIALQHDPSALLAYVEELIVTARARGAPPAQLQALHSAKNVIRISKAVAGAVPPDTKVLMDVVSDVRKEMRRRNALKASERVKEEESPCDLYNRIRVKLPNSLRTQSFIPAELKGPRMFGLSQGAKFNDNLRAIIKLISALLEHGAILSVGGYRGQSSGGGSPAQGK